MNEISPTSFLSTDKTKPAVKQIFGISGSGKTTFMAEMLGRVLLSPSLPPHFRIVVFDVKHDGYTHLAEPVNDWRQIVNSIKKNRITIIHPPIEDAQLILNEVINHLFELSERIEDFGASLIIEESSTYIKSTPHGVPDSIKRLATQGRAVNLGVILCNQRALNSKWTDTQTSTLILFRLPMADLYMTEKRWNIDAEEVDTKLKTQKFSYALYDLENLEISYYNPLNIRPTP